MRGNLWNGKQRSCICGKVSVICVSAESAREKLSSARTARINTISASGRRDFSSHEWHERHDFRKRKTRFFYARIARINTISASERHDFSSHERHEWHDFRKRNIQFFFARFFFIRFFFARMARINTISASGRHDFSSHEWHEQTRFPQAEDTIFQRTNGTNKYDFRKRKTRFFYARMARTNTIFASERHDLFSAFVRDNRVIDLSISSHSCLSCKAFSLADFADTQIYLSYNPADDLSGFLKPQMRG